MFGALSIALALLSQVDAIDAKIKEYVPLVDWFARKQRDSINSTMVTQFKPKAVLGMHALLLVWRLLPEIKALLEAAFKEIAYCPDGPSFHRTKRNFDHFDVHNKKRSLSRMHPAQ